MPTDVDARWRAVTDVDVRPLADVNVRWRAQREWDFKIYLEKRVVIKSVYVNNWRCNFAFLNRSRNITVVVPRTRNVDEWMRWNTVLLGGGHFTPYDTYTYTHQGQFQYDDSNWVTRYEGLPNYQLRPYASAVYAVADCLSVCPSITSWYAIKTAKYEHIIT